MYLLNVRSTDITLIIVHVSMNNLLTCDIFLVASQVWSWLRIPVGRPRLKTPRVVDQANMEDLRPTVAYLWDHVSPPVRVTEWSYIEFSNELDALVLSSVSNFIISSSVYKFCQTLSCNHLLVFIGYLEAVRGSGTGTPKGYGWIKCNVHS
jgi:hypothetical protein